MSRLLVIDAQPESIDPLIAFLADKSLDVVVAGSCAEGQAKAIAERPDLILLDMNLSGHGGIDVCRGLKEDKRTASIPVIFASASSDIDDKLQAFSQGAVDYFVKPFSEIEAAARIFVHLDAKRRLDRLETMVAQAALERVGEDVAFPDDQLFSQALVILEKRMAAPPSLVELSRELGTNERRLTEIFRQRVGMTVFDYFSEMRLESARHLLEESQMRIGAIASHVGYRNAGDFTRAFRRHYGVTPREHRQSHQGELAEID